MKLVFAWLLFYTWCMPGRIPDAPHTLTLRFRARVGDQDLQLHDRVYTNRFAEPFTISRFKYYVSHIRAAGPDGVEMPLSDQTCLIDEGDSSSQTLVLTTSLTGIRTISFVLGVDSILQVSGVQEGDLDPLRGMFWTWNSGYIFAKLEGRSDSSHAPAHSCSWDIGGFRSPANASRTIRLIVPEGQTAATGPGSQDAGAIILINADLSKWFDGAHPLRISQHPLCHQAGDLAMQIADNYSTMFSIVP